MKQSKPAISVIIPVYNGEKYIERCVYSVLLQPCANALEIIIINDGSKDRTAEICDKISQEYGNVTVIHKENGGVASARNIGIEKATGQYVAFLDSDDWWEDNFLDNNMLCQIRGGV